jgi:hypothetical protein
MGGGSTWPNALTIIRRIRRGEENDDTFPLSLYSFLAASLPFLFAAAGECVGVLGLVGGTTTKV